MSSRNSLVEAVAHALGGKWTELRKGVSPEDELREIQAILAKNG
jgi:hypothetical protein